MDKLINTYCKIILHPPDHKKAHVLTGIITAIDHTTNQIKLTTKHGETTLDLNQIIAIKPKQKQNHIQ